MYLAHVHYGKSFCLMFTIKLICSSRVDLHPVNSHGSALPNEDELPPPLNPDGEVMPDASHIDPAVMRAMPRHERIAALRRALASRTRQVTQDPQAAAAPAPEVSGVERSRRTRLLASITRTFRDI